nr:nucleotidyltransferase domain-containing protein [Deinobacterium chartae]
MKVLRELEAEHGVRVLYACESGSRAWGFASPDSDWDVRFVYLRAPRDYLSVEEGRRDVIERALDLDDLDVTGWDLPKALRLLRASNPPLIEWLGSPLVYRDDLNTRERLRTLLDEAYSPVAARYHYLHMARGNYRDYLRGETVRLKKYLYVLRPLLAVLWIERGLGPVPTPFAQLLDATVEDAVLRAEIDDLLARKAAGGELGEGPRRPVLNAFIERELHRLEGVRRLTRAPRGDIARFDAVFHDLLRAAYPQTAL